MGQKSSNLHTSKDDPVPNLQRDHKLWLAASEMKNQPFPAFFQDNSAVNPPDWPKKNTMDSWFLATEGRLRRAEINASPQRFDMAIANHKLESHLWRWFDDVWWCFMRFLNGETLEKEEATFILSSHPHYFTLMTIFFWDNSTYSGTSFQHQTTKSRPSRRAWSRQSLHSWRSLHPR